MSVQDEIVARIAKMHFSQTGMAYELMLDYLAKHPDATVDECWQVVRFAGQQQKKIDIDQRQHSNSIDTPADGTPPVPAYDDGRPGSEFITRDELEPFATTDFEIDVASLAGHLSDAEIAARLGKSVRSVTRTISTTAKRSGLPLYIGPTLTREHDSTVRACVREGSELFYVALFAGDWLVVEKESLDVEPGTLEPWKVIDAHFNSEDPETRFWYHDFTRDLRYIEVLCDKE